MTRRYGRWRRISTWRRVSRWITSFLVEIRQVLAGRAASWRCAGYGFPASSLPKAWTAARAVWSHEPELNRRPAVYKAAALPAELSWLWPVTLIRRHPLNGVGCRSLPSASRHAYEPTISRSEFPFLVHISDVHPYGRLILVDYLRTSTVVAPGASR